MLLENKNEKYIQLFSYLKEFSLLSERTTREIDNYEDYIFFKDIPQGDKNTCIAWDEADKDNPEWIRLNKPAEPQFPMPPLSILKWMDENALKDCSNVPKLKDQLVEKDIVLKLADNKHILIDFQNYINFKWQQWAKEYVAFEKKHNVYKHLFDIYQKAKKYSEEFELIVGIGLIFYKTEKTPLIKRHLIIVYAALEFDSVKNMFTLYVAADGAKLKIESQVIEGIDGISDLLSSTKQLENNLEKKDLLESPFDSEIEAEIHNFINRINPGSKYSHEIALPEIVPSQLYVIYAPALILRKRNIKSLSSLFQNIINNLSQNITLDISILNDIVASHESVVNTHKHENIGTNNFEEIFFPKSYNDDQVKIIEYLRHSQKVLVQGPPGTGKSHTIANIICHLLAQGKRILITAYTKRALTVLKNQLPDDLKPLCVNLLGNDRESMNDLEASVKEITGRLNNHDVHKIKNEITTIEAELKDLKKNKAFLDNNLIDIKEMDNREHTVNSLYSGKIIDIAKQIDLNRAENDWFQDSVISLDHMPELIHKIIRFHYLLNMMNSITNKFDPSLKIPDINILVDPEEYKYFIINKYETSNNFEKSKVFHFQWSEKAFKDCMSGLREYWESVYQETKKIITENLKNLIDKYEKDFKIEYPKEISKQQLKNDAKILLEHLQKGHHLQIPELLKIFKPRDIKERWYFIEKVFINGSPCDTEDELISFIEFINIELDFEKLTNLWKGEISSGANYTVKFIEYKTTISELESILKITSDLANFEDKLKTQIDLIDKHLSLNKSHPVAIAIKDAVEHNNHISYAKLYAELTSLSAMYSNYNEFNNLKDDLLKKTPCFVDGITQNKISLALINESSLSEAILFKHAIQWLMEFIKDHSDTKIEQRIKDISEEISNKIARLASQKAWQNVFETITQYQRSELIAWSQSMKKVGKGTGKNAYKFRKEAQEHMNNCRTSIPAWIMPIFRIAETVKPAPEMFDCIIIDEASQAGPEALFLLYLAKKIIIVGDDKQTAPEYVGIQKDTVNQLIEKYLYNIPYKNSYGTEYSFFEHAERFCESNLGKITLQEHFRCMPEIIEFSNKHFYEPFRNPLYPMRQYSEKRLPPIKKVLVNNGYSEGTSQNIRNIPEAEKIVQTIGDCINDTQYKNKTIGVITLQGNTQAREIEKMLLDQIGPEEMEKRKLVSGNSASFQGDERDIIFLSLVVSRNYNFRALTGDADRRRFNVAVSRARDQIWLFHSVTIADLSNKEDMRYKLLEHFYADENPFEHLKKIDTTDHDKLPLPFESWFEVEIYEKIKAKGYNVIPQYEVAKGGRFRIDLAVILNNGIKIAVECDGDKYHGPEQFRNDVLRQRTLERCGWQFFRIRGCEYYLSSSTVLENLWKLLQRNDDYCMEKPFNEEYKKEETIKPEQKIIQMINTIEKQFDVKDINDQEWQNLLTWLHDNKGSSLIAANGRINKGEIDKAIYFIEKVIRRGNIDKLKPYQRDFMKHIYEAYAEHLQ